MHISDKSILFIKWMHFKSLFIFTVMQTCDSWEGFKKHLLKTLISNLRYPSQFRQQNWKETQLSQTSQNQGQYKSSHVRKKNELDTIRRIRMCEEIAFLIADTVFSGRRKSINRAPAFSQCHLSLLWCVHSGVYWLKCGKQPYLEINKT